jgi:hypothetical protein
MKKTMKNPTTGMYHIGNNKYKMLIGSRTQVYNGNAYKTEGGLVKEQLLMNRWGRIVSRKKHDTASKERRLEKYGYFAEKGKFGYVRKTAKKSSSHSISQKNKNFIKRFLT